jgi:transcriptional regulator with XRE-family HTH domain
VSELIRVRRIHRGLNQADLAEQIEVARNTIVRWEGGENQPTAPMRRKLAQALGGKPDEYEWSEIDFEQRDRRIEITLTINRVRRRLVSSG